jgi:predicted cupin superfamily sugar epimerase
MGSDIASGEVTQLFVPGGWWKASELPEEDRLLLDSPLAEEQGLKERIGCLISEVVVPGWNPDQHQFIDEDKVCLYLVTRAVLGSSRRCVVC